MEASSSAAPSGAGTSGSQSSPNSTGNSAGGSQNAQRPTGAAPTSSRQPGQGQQRTQGNDSDQHFQSVEQREQQAAPKQNAKPVENDDPEWDLGDGRKYKRSQYLNELNRARASQQAEAKRVAALNQQNKALAESMQALGLDPSAFNSRESAIAAFEKAAQQHYARRVEEATMDPAEKELRDLRAENEKFKKDFEAQQETQRKQQHEQKVTARVDHLAGEIASALETSGLPRDPSTVARMATLVLAAKKQGLSLSMSEIAQRVSSQIFNEQNSVVSGLNDGASIVKFLGDKAELVRQYYVDQANEARAPFQPQQQQPNKPTPRPAAPSKHPNGYTTLDQIRARQQKARR